MTGCDPAFEVVADRFFARGAGAGAVEYYSGSFCFPTGAIPGESAITSAVLMAPIELPSVAVHHNPHSEVLVSRIPTWFWHEGPTSHTQSATYNVDARTTLVGRYDGRAILYCWTIDDPRGDLPLRELGGSRCEAPGGTTYLATAPGADSEQGAAATHTFDAHGFTTRITHEVVWAGTVTITDGPAALIGQEFPVTPTVIRAQTERPVQQIIPVLVPPEG